MPLNPQLLASYMPIVTHHEYTRRDTMLYALGVGVAFEDPTDEASLRYVFEDGLIALPTMAAVLGYPGFWQKDPKFDLDWPRILHGEQSIEIHRPIPVEGSVRAETTIDKIFDKGADKGAVLYVRREISDADTGEPLATVRQTSLLRGDGGFGGSREGIREPFTLPDRPCDTVLETASAQNQALIYRLSGDFNPLHVSPEVAHKVGFERPILHGLCTFGLVGRTLVAHLCDDKPERMRRLDVRFSGHVFPGETLRTEVWIEGEGVAAFRSTAIERGKVVLNNGFVRFA